MRKRKYRRAVEQDTVYGRRKIRGPYRDGTHNIVILIDADRSTKVMGYARFVMQEHLGRILKNDEYVFHINGDKTDDRIDNLKVVKRAVFEDTVYGKRVVLGPYYDKHWKRDFVTLKDKNGSTKRLMYARHVMQEKIGRVLESNEHVTHINKDTTDDRLSNLKVVWKHNRKRGNQNERNVS